LCVENARESEHAGRERRNGEIAPVARQLAKELAAVAQSRLVDPHLGNLLEGFIERVSAVERVWWFAPERFAYIPVRAADAVQALLGAVVDARNALKTEQRSQGERELVVQR